MKNYNRDGRIWKAAMLMLLLSASTACSLLTPAPVVVMPEARAVYLKAGAQTPFDGWVISTSAMDRLLKAAEQCKATTTK